jgi:hypothetical protein
MAHPSLKKRIDGLRAVAAELYELSDLADKFYDLADAIMAEVERMNARESRKRKPTRTSASRR